MKNNKLIIGVDQGTTGTTVVAVNASLNIISSWSRQHTQHRPGPGLLEHLPSEIVEAVVEGVRSVLEDLGKDRGDVTAIGLANQGETVCAWDTKTGQSLHNAIVWADARGGNYIDRLTSSQSDRLAAITGLQPDTYFSAPKLAWMMENCPDIHQALEHDRLGIGTLDSWIIWKLSGGHVYSTDVSTAARTMLFDISEEQWSDEALAMFGLENLPKPAACLSCEHIADLSHKSWPIAPIPLFASVVDQPAALFAHGCWELGQVKATYGTGCFLLMNTGSSLVTDKNGLTASIAWDIGDGPAYMLDGAVYAAGSIIEWIKNDLGWIDTVEQIDPMVAGSSADNAPIFVPTLDGLSAPHWDRNVKGMITGLTLSVKPADIVRAALDGIAHQVADLMQVMQQTVDSSIDDLHVDGGLSASDYLMQKQADLLGLPVAVATTSEMTALGAAAMASLGAGITTREDLRQSLSELPRKTFHPAISSQQRFKERSKWKDAIQLALSAGEKFSSGE